MHTWKPDAYGEAPGVVGALLAGGLTTCAFLALLRCYHIADAGGEGEFARTLLIRIGLVSMAVGAVFMVRQRDFKRMLAYSSVEHMGILVLGVGIGGLALFGALLAPRVQRPHQGRAVPRRGEHPPRVRQQEHGGRARRDPPRPDLRRPVPRRLLRRDRLAPVRAVPLGAHDPARHDAGRALSRRRAVPDPVVRRVRRHGVERARHDHGPATRRPPRDRLSRQLRDRGGPGDPARARARLGLYLPPALGTMVTDAAHLLGAR